MRIPIPLFIIGCIFSFFSMTNATKPNFLFIVADDLGYNDVGFLREKKGLGAIPTPVLDDLAYGGVRFDHLYVQPLCSPTRSTLMTGRYPFRTGFQRGVVRPSSPYGLPLTEVTLPQELKHYGYTNYLVGKWHLGYYKNEYTPVARGFDYHYGSYFSTSHMNHNKTYYYYGLNWVQDWAATETTPEIHLHQNKRTPLFTSADLALEAKEIFENHNKSLPFYMQLSFLAPHTPLDIDEENDVGECGDGRFPEEKRRVYCSMVHGMDTAIGQVVQALKNENLYEDTIIIFMSDNGGVLPQASNYPHRGQKMSLFEGGVRAPMFVHNPSRLPADPDIRTGILHSTDWFTTLIALAHNENKARNPAFTSFSSFSPSRPSLEGGDEGERVVDGVNIWPYIYGTAGASPRSGVLVNIDIEGEGISANHSAMLFTYTPTETCQIPSRNGHIFKYFFGPPGGPEGAGGWDAELGCWGGTGNEAWEGVEGAEGCAFLLDEGGEGLVDLTRDPGERVNLLLLEGEGGGEGGLGCIAEMGRGMVREFGEGEGGEGGLVKALFTTVPDSRSNPGERGGWWLPWVDGEEGK